jgi:hypothetical protein
MRVSLPSRQLPAVVRNGETIAANFSIKRMASTSRPVKRQMREMFQALPA